MKQSNYRPTQIAMPKREAGVALIISLVLLLVMTILGLAAVRGISSEERMVAQTYDRTVAFQAAEATLRGAENLIELGQSEPAVGTGCALKAAGPDMVMVCSPPDPAATPRWLDSAFTSWTPAVATGTGSFVITPDYFIEYLGKTFSCGFDPVNDANTCKRYRITVRSKPGNGRAAVTLQSIYATSSS
jgi:type IV pilus assembly protein PilX